MKDQTGYRGLPEDTIVLSMCDLSSKIGESYYRLRAHSQSGISPHDSFASIEERTTNNGHNGILLSELGFQLPPQYGVGYIDYDKRDDTAIAEFRASLDEGWGHPFNAPNHPVALWLMKHYATKPFDSEEINRTLNQHFTTAGKERSIRRLSKIERRAKYSILGAVAGGLLLIAGASIHHRFFQPPTVAHYAQIEQHIGHLQETLDTPNVELLPQDLQTRILEQTSQNLDESITAWQDASKYLQNTDSFKTHQTINKAFTGSIFGSGFFAFGSALAAAYSSRRRDKVLASEPVTKELVLQHLEKYGRKSA